MQECDRASTGSYTTIRKHTDVVSTASAIELNAPINKTDRDILIRFVCKICPAKRIKKGKVECFWLVIRIYWRYTLKILSFLSCR